MENNQQLALREALDEVKGFLTTVEQELVFTERVIPFYLGGEDYNYVSQIDLLVTVNWDV